MHVGTGRAEVRTKFPLTPWAKLREQRPLDQAPRRTLDITGETRAALASLERLEDATLEETGYLAYDTSFPLALRMVKT